MLFTTNFLSVLIGLLNIFQTYSPLINGVHVWSNYEPWEAIPIRVELYDRASSIPKDSSVRWKLDTEGLQDLKTAVTLLLGYRVDTRNKRTMNAIKRIATVFSSRATDNAILLP